MRLISLTTRITLGLIGLALCVWLMAFLLGMFPDRQEAVLHGREALLESLAQELARFAKTDNPTQTQAFLAGIVERNPDLLSTAIRDSQGKILASTGAHLENWNLGSNEPSNSLAIRVPLNLGGTGEAALEARFRETTEETSWARRRPMVAWSLFSGAATFLLYFVYLRKMLRHLDPSGAIPRHVRRTLDTMAEGMLVLDSRRRILLANRAFAEWIGIAADELTGRWIDELPFGGTEEPKKNGDFPWDRALAEGTPQVGELIKFRGVRPEPMVMKVSATPIFADDGQLCGALTSFADVTVFEQSRAELTQMLDALSHSRDEIQRQNQELGRLANRDPLTGCSNRRAFFVDLESHWNAASRYGYPISCVMVDLDHFKSINDLLGHRAGDLVLQKAADRIRQSRRPSDLVCRYGGEEFCVVLPHTDLEAAVVVAEHIRAAIASADFDGATVTASLGVSSRELGATDPQALIDQADKSLYVAKRKGRNRVARFDRVADEIAIFEREGASLPKRAISGQEGDEDREGVIPFHAVTALLSALAYRDQATADHARRVADLCVAAARRLMPMSESYLLEIAALLHDIGKIGVPDAILLKPGKLSEDDWRVMNSHERIGVEIVHSTFASPKLAEIIRLYRAWYGGAPRRPDLPRGNEIPLAARILAIADAYDSMTHYAPYRPSLSREEAFAELRRCAHSQFDPELVERFVDCVIRLDEQALGKGVEPTNPIALSLGTQIERLAQALDTNDLGSIATLAERLNQAAIKHQATDIARVAAQLHQASRKDSDVKRLVQLTIELLDLCRATQRACLNDAVGSLAPSAGGGPRADDREIDPRGAGDLQPTAEVGRA